MRHTALAITTVLLIATTAACGGGNSEPASQPSGGTDSGPAASSLPQGSEPVQLDPADFTTAIDNPWWPLKPGNHWVYRETDADGNVQRVDVTVTNRTKTIMGIETRVIHDIVTDRGKPTEDTYDWYVQDSVGNIWYMGEDTKEYNSRGKLTSTEGSWEAGVDGAQPGIVVLARPKPGLAYREEYYKGQAEDAAEVLSLNAQANVPNGSFDHVVQTRNDTALEPDLVEEKFYARGVGPVLEITVTGGSDRDELISFK